MKDTSKLSDIDHKNIDTFLRTALDDYKNGIISRSTVVNCLGHIIAAIDGNNHSEARKWFENPEYLRHADKDN